MTDMSIGWTVYHPTDPENGMGKLLSIEFISPTQQSFTAPQVVLRLLSDGSELDFVAKLYLFNFVSKS